MHGWYFHNRPVLQQHQIIFSLMLFIYQCDENYKLFFINMKPSVVL